MGPEPPSCPVAAGSCLSLRPHEVSLCDGAVVSSPAVECDLESRGGRTPVQRADWLFCFFLGVPFSLRLDLLVAGPPPRPHAPEGCRH